MKKILVLIFICGMLFNGCRKPQPVPSLTSVIKNGDWRVSYMKNSGSDLTVLYRGLRFTFLTDSTVKISDGVNQYNGVWGEDPVKKKFVLAINSTRFELGLISREWEINFITPGQVKFRDDNFTPTQELRLNTW